MGKTVLAIFTIVFIASCNHVRGQGQNYYFNLQVSGGYITPGTIPFWIRANNFGSIPLDGTSFSLISSFRREYDLQGDKLFDWGLSLEGRANLGEETNFRLVEGFGKIKLGFFEFKAGRSKQIMGLCDSTLSSGSWSVSGNSIGIPKIEVSVPEFTEVPFLKDLIALKGNYAQGWMGPMAMMAGFEVDSVQLDGYLHQKSLYIRFGKPEWRIKLYGGFNHQVVWCKGEDYYNDDFKLTQATEYLYVISGKPYNSGSIIAERLGNHLGSIDIGIEYDFKEIRLFIYRQNIYEAGTLSHLANIQDGLNGLTITNKQIGVNGLKWSKLLIEFLYTKNQAGRPWSPDTPSPYEPYYNHGQYIDGWSYKGMGLGSPFVTTRTFVRAGIPSYPWEFFINNRLYVFHFGCEGSLMTFDYKIKTSWSRNYGTYRTTDEEQSTGIPSPGSTGIFGERDQFSAYVGINRKVREKLTLGVTGALDLGELYYNSLGVFVTSSYTFN